MIPPRFGLGPWRRKRDDDEPGVPAPDERGRDAAPPDRHPSEAETLISGDEAVSSEAETLVSPPTEQPPPRPAPGPPPQRSSHGPPPSPHRPASPAPRHRQPELPAQPPAPRPQRLGPPLPEAPAMGHISRSWRRRLADVEWPRPGFAADGGRLGEFEVLAASVIGQRHLHEASQRQDAYHLAAAGDAAVLAIADGVSAKPLAAIGAETAAFVAVRTALATGRAASVAACLAAAVDRAEAAVREAATYLRVEPRELSTTLLIADLRRAPSGEVVVTTAGVGNSSALEVAGAAPPRVLAGPRPDDPSADHGEFVPGARSGARIAQTALREGAALVLATDGFAEDLHDSAGVREWLWDRLGSAGSPLEFAHALAYRRQGSMDDLTAVAARLAPSS